jgi:hypothetical protein
MFNPSQSDVRRFFCAIYQKWLIKDTMDGIETIAALWIAEHPEYHADLSDADAAVAREYSVDSGRINPFLHLSMHLSISEQSSIDHHIAMEALGTMMWESQRSGQPPNGETYIESIKKAASK